MTPYTDDEMKRICTDRADRGISGCHGCKCFGQCDGQAQVVILRNRERSICPKCRAGFHGHHDPTRYLNWENLERHELWDVCDCKNLVPDGQCMCRVTKDRYVPKLEL